MDDILRSIANGYFNVEIKARCGDPVKIREKLRSEQAFFRGTDRQVDTYFKVNRGRLKLREGNIENHLIFYERQDCPGPKTSEVILVRHKDDKNLKEMLTRSLGILTVVDKSREIYFIGNVKFHIDTVKGLGNFVEIEVIGKEGKIPREDLEYQCDKYIKLLGIAGEDLVTNSYSDMILTRTS